MAARTLERTADYWSFDKVQIFASILSLATYLDQVRGRLLLVVVLHVFRMGLRVTVEKLSTGRGNAVSWTAERIEELELENARLREALKRARELARVHNYTMREFALHCGITPTQLSQWTDSTPNKEPNFKD